MIIVAAILNMIKGEGISTLSILTYFVCIIAEMLVE